MHLKSSFWFRCWLRAAPGRSGLQKKQGDSVYRNVFDELESPSHGCAVTAPFSKGGLWSRTGTFKHPSPPCQRGVPPQGAGGFHLPRICRARRPRRAVLRRQRDFVRRNSWKKESPSQRLRRCQPPFARGPYPLRGTRISGIYGTSVIAPGCDLTRPGLWFILGANALIGKEIREWQDFSTRSQPVSCC